VSFVELQREREMRRGKLRRCGFMALGSRHCAFIVGYGVGKLVFACGTVTFADEIANDGPQAGGNVMQRLAPALRERATFSQALAVAI
jgi:hypothetical protein